MTRYFTASCSNAVEYYRGTNFPWTSTTSAPTYAPNPIFNHIDFRIDALETATAAFVDYPGTSTVYNAVNIYNNTHVTGWRSDTLDGHHGTYYEDLAGQGTLDEGRRAYANAPVDNSSATCDGRAYFGSSRCAYDGKNWVINTTRPGGFGIRFAHDEATMGTFPAVQRNATTINENGIALDNGYWMEDLCFHDNSWYFLMRATNGQNRNSMIVKTNRDFTTQVAGTIIGMTHAHRIAPAGDGYIWVGSEAVPSQVACVYNKNNLAMAMTEFSGAYSRWPASAMVCTTVDTIWTDGYCAYVGVNNASVYGRVFPANSHTHGAGIFAMHYTPPPDDSWTYYVGAHHTAYKSVSEGGVMGPFGLAYILSDTVGAPATTAMYLAYRPRTDLFNGQPTFQSTYLPMQSKTNKYYGNKTTHLSTWAYGRNDRIMVGRDVSGASAPTCETLQELQILTEPQSATNAGFRRYSLTNCKNAGGYDPLFSTEFLRNTSFYDYAGHTRMNNVKCIRYGGGAMFAIVDTTAAGGVMVYKDPMPGG